MLRFAFRAIVRCAACRDEDGQGLTEYGLILGIITIFCIAALKTFGDTTNSALNSVASSLSTVS